MSLRRVDRCLCQAAIVPLLAIALSTGCGKKGPPLPPLVRIPEAPAVVATRRIGSDTYVTVRIPARNVDGSTLVPIAAVELLALTAESTPSRAIFLERGTTVSSIPVTAPPSPSTSAPAVSPGESPAAKPSGASPGDEVTVREALTGEMLVPVPLPVTPAETSRATPPAPVSANPPGSVQNDASRPDATPPEVRRYYMGITRDARRRPGPSGPVTSVSLASLPDAPREPRVTYNEQTLTVAWTAVAGAAGYNVYKDSGGTAPAPDAAPGPGAATMPRPLNATPLDATTYSEPVRFGELACYRVRALRGSANDLGEGPASPAVCERPADTFPPAAPAEIRVVAAPGEIAIDWTPVSETDLAGYLVLRGRAGDDTLQPITAAPIRETQFVDRDVTPGVRYTYAVVAVDAASNRSAASMRDDATAR